MNSTEFPFLEQLGHMHPSDAVERFLPEQLCKRVAFVPSNANLPERTVTSLLNYLSAHTSAALRAQDLTWISATQNLAELLLPFTEPRADNELWRVQARAQLDAYESMLEYGRQVALAAEQAQRAGAPAPVDPLALRRAKRLQDPAFSG